MVCSLFVLLALPGPARPAVRAGAGWRWPVHGRVAGSFRLTPGRPFAAGQRRGIDIAAARGASVVAACAGRVRFAGALPGRGLSVSVRCGDLVATELGLARLAVRAGARVAAGERVGELGGLGVLRLGARRSGERFGYLDPLALLRDPRPVGPPALGRAPRGRPRRPARPIAAHPRVVGRAPVASRAPAPAAAPFGLPWAAYPALALVASAVPVGGLVRRGRRRRAARAPKVVGDAR
jgi:peptidase M23-like protein